MLFDGNRIDVSYMENHVTVSSSPYFAICSYYAMSEVGL